MKVIFPSSVKAQVGETLRFLVKGPLPSVVLVSPRERPKQVVARKTSSGYLVEYSSTDSEGLYVFTVTSGRRTLKRWFLVGNLVMDWVPASFALRDEGKRVSEVISAFSEVGNVVVAHSLCSWRGALYPSRGFPIEKGLESDPLDVILRTSQAKGVAVLFSYHWVPRRDVDMWVHPGPKEIASAKRMITELHALYSSYPSMAGFYAYWEPGDVKEVTYYRQTTRHVKSIDSGLLTGAAPYVFSTDRYLGGTLPAMISTLSSVETLDFIVPQSSIAIWPYPINRTKDHLRLATGSLLDSPSRMALGHIETFPRYFVEGERVLPSSVVVGQLLSTSMTRGASGVTTFIFSYLLDRKDGALADFRKAMDWFRSTERLRRSKSQVAAFFPQDPTYWPTVGTKVLASLRQAGLDIDPVQMPQGGSSSWLKLATSRHRVLILFDPPELKPFEARALAAMCKSGSSLIVLGYPPSGLREVLGVESRNIGKYGGFKLVERVGPRTPEGEVMKLGYEFVFCPTLRGAEPLAVLESIPHGFQPGAFAITRHRFGRGTSYFVAIPSLVALDRARDLLLDLVEAAMSGKGSAIPWEVDGLTQECDLLAGEDFLAVVNLGQEEISALARYTGSIESNRIVVSGAGSEVKTDGGVVRVNLKLKPMSPVLVTLFE